MSRVERDPERGRAAAAKLKALGVKGILIKAAEQGYITQLACKMPECFCPEELGGACYFEPVTREWSDWRSDWMPTLEHFPVAKKEGGKAVVDNAILAHRLCNRLDHSLRVGRSHRRDLDRIRKSPRGRDPPQQRKIVGRLRLALARRPPPADASPRVRRVASRTSAKRLAGSATFRRDRSVRTPRIHAEGFCGTRQI
jgi:hypothetical protein